MNQTWIFSLYSCPCTAMRLVQSVVEKMLMKEQNVTRLDLGREQFTNKVWEWKQE